MDRNENRNNQSGEYDFNKPDAIYPLPKKLKEISGIEYMGDSIIAAIEDEKGEIYYFDLQSRTIVQKMNFATPGDYEAIARRQNHLYILRSDAVVFKFFQGKTEMIQTSLRPEENTEGLAYDSIHNQLLIGSKSESKIYFLSLETKKILPESTINLQKYNISISGMAIHPNTQELYVLSEKEVLILNASGKLKEVVFLKSSLFQNPEGITFTNEGDIFISNEGKKNTANILLFKRKNED